MDSQSKIYILAAIVFILLIACSYLKLQNIKIKRALKEKDFEISEIRKNILSVS